MITFTTDNWQIDLTNYNLTLVEENSLFFDFMVSKYSLPFSFELDDEMAASFGFIEHENSIDVETRYDGVLQEGGNLYPAVLEISGVVDNKVSGSFVYGNENIPLLDTKLKDLPFPVIHTDNLRAHASQVISQQFPETAYNFPMIIDPEWHQNTNYELFRGVVNFYNNGYPINDFITDENGERIVANYYALTPYPYLMEILKVGFNYAGLDYGGDFISDPVSRKIIWDTGMVLEQFTSRLPLFAYMDTPDSVEEIEGVEYAEYSLSYAVDRAGTYTLRMFLKLPEHQQIEEYKVQLGDRILYESTLQYIDVKRAINIADGNDFTTLTVSLRVKNTNTGTSTGDISMRNFINMTLDDSVSNIFADTFTLSDVLPDMTFATFLNKLKNWLNLDIDITSTSVTIDYVENKFMESTYKDQSHLQVEKFNKEFNTNIAYTLKSSGRNLYVTKEGLVSNLSQYREENIREIDLSAYTQKIQSRYGVTTARRIIDNDFQLLLYDGLQNGAPVAVDQVNDIGFYPEDMYQRLWKNWLFFRINSKRITEKFECDALEELSTRFGIYKYNHKMLIKKITKQVISESVISVSQESETQ